MTRLFWKSLSREDFEENMDSELLNVVYRGYDLVLNKIEWVNTYEMEHFVAVIFFPTRVEMSTEGVDLLL
jgi:hypothetical protein